MGYYKIEFEANGKSKHDIYFADSAQQAVDYCRRDYSHIGDYRTTRVYKDTGARWEVTEAWE